MTDKGYDVMEGIEYIISEITSKGWLDEFNRQRQQYNNPVATAKTRTEYLNNVLEVANCAYEKTLWHKNHFNRLPIFWEYNEPRYDPFKDNELLKKYKFD